MTEQMNQQDHEQEKAGAKHPYPEHPSGTQDDGGDYVLDRQPKLTDDDDDA